MSELFLIAEIDGAMIAIESDMVESVVRVQDFIPVPRVDPLVAGIFALRSRVLTLIDTQFAVTEKPRPVPENALAIIAQIGGFHFGLLVDAVKDVVTVQPEQYVTSIKAGSNWMPYSKGLVDVDGQIVVIICPAKIVEGKQDMAA
jgi:purine-binding chemotaxis protein CheW